MLAERSVSASQSTHNSERAGSTILDESNRPSDELTLAVVGIPYLNADGSSRLFELRLCQPGDAIDLRPEPKNKHDPHAIGVWRAGGGQFGYLTFERAGWIGRRLQAEDSVAVYQGAVGSAAYIRIRFGGGAPTLPPVSEQPEQRATNDDFYPDPDGPDFGA
ncbi:MAG TPA: HIRAN domain-containing protein [Sphingomonas sp.]|nr:HIRAN domain-containing protein [Sphingomonas sp.]